jgi:predicted NAD/FAD-binding protein
MKRIAVIGSGISGLASAYLLSRRHIVHLFERSERLGGHTHTVTVQSSAGPVALDTGFLVHNEKTYPGLVRLFREIDVATVASDMCFGVACSATRFEYSSRGPRGFFAQPRNLVSATHLRLLSEILRFNREAPKLLAARDVEWMTLGDFLDAGRFSTEFVHRYLLPMASAICLLAVTGQPTWRVVQGGSATYIPKLIAPLGERVHRSTSITRVGRTEAGVTVQFSDRPAMPFDEVVFACHGDQVLPLLADASDHEREVFGSFRTTTNVAWLHTDTSVLPRRQAARASWNYRLQSEQDAAPTVTYDLNRLQRLRTHERFCVTLNPADAIDDRQVIARVTFRHPQFDHAALRAQRRWAEVSGVRRTHYCGAYWQHGFHEDGLRSALRVARALGVDW